MVKIIILITNNLILIIFDSLDLSYKEELNNSKFIKNK
jgi:hypothetical protein